MKRVRLDIEEWMINHYDLGGLLLFIYALIYAELEVSVLDIAEWIHISKREAAKNIKILLDMGLVEGHLETDEYILKDHKFEKNTKRMLYTCNEDCLL